MIPKLQKYYYDKELFIKDFIKFCRDVKQEAIGDGRGMKMMINKFVGVCGESWQFIVTADERSVWTEARRFHFVHSSGQTIDQSVHYPKTKWGDAGGTGARWDSELREFLRREINKEVPWFLNVSF